MQQSRLRRFRVVAQCRHGLVAELEMEGEFGRTDVGYLGALALERDCDLAMHLDAGKRGDALVKHLPVQRMAKGIPPVRHPSATVAGAQAPRRIRPPMRRRVRSTRATVASRNSTPQTLAASSSARSPGASCRM